MSASESFGKAASAEADSGAEEARPDPAIEPDPLGDLDHVRPGRLADVRDLVDERDPGHQRGVGGELDHLRRGDVGPDDGTVDAVVKALDRIGVGGIEGADHDPVRMHEVAHRRSLGGELGVRGVADLGHPSLVEAVAHLETGPHGDGALHHHDDPAIDLRQLVDHRPDRRQIGVARERGRRPDRHVDEVGAVDRLGHVGREDEPLGVARQEVVEPGLVNRDLAAAQRGNALGDDVADDDVVAELGEAGTRDEADVSGSEDCDAFWLGTHGRAQDSRTGEVVRYRSTAPKGLRPFAIAIIVSFESRSRSVFTTQYDASGVRSTTMWSRGPL